MQLALAEGVSSARRLISRIRSRLHPPRSGGALDEVRAIRQGYEEASTLGRESPNRWVRRSAEVPGWLFPGEHEFIVEQALAAPPGHFVEIGVLFGKSTSLIAGAIEERGIGERLFAVDPFSVAGSARDAYVHRVTHGQANTFPTFQELAGRFGYADKVVVLANYSHDCLPYLDLKVGFALIDGNHERGPVLADFELIYPKLVPGAVVLFHDAIGDAFPGVMLAVGDIQRRFPDCREAGRAGTIVALNCKLG